MTICALTLALAHCGGDGSACLTSSSSCEGNTLVQCVSSRGSPGRIQRTGCATVCLQRGSQAACVEAAEPCDAQSYQERCVMQPGEQMLRVCRAPFTSTMMAWPVLVPASCDSGDAVVCNADGSVARSRCQHGNTCTEVRVSSGSVQQLCLYDSTACTDGYRPLCVAQGAVLCRDATGRGDRYPLIVPSSEAEARMACP
ncbi:MAG: hypothetical protein HY909_06600 [Deltaproteobacteria bacterium]|nr:hypothetical protein [Deltaproteobacteria bacterium]